MKQLVLLLTLTLTALTGTEAKPIPQPKAGTVIIYRKPTAGSYLEWNPLTGFLGSALAGAMGAAAPLPLCINGKPVCKLNYGCYYKLELASGDYLFTQGGWGWPLCRQPVHVIAGKTLYFGYYRSAYHYTFEVAEDQNEARQVVSKLKPEN